MLSRFSFVWASALVVSLANGQLHTDCNPLNVTCPPDPAFGTQHTFLFNSTPPTGVFNQTGGGTITYNPDPAKGASITLNKQGDSPTIVSNFYFFFGRTEIVMKAAPGRGIISCIVWASDTLDEVDWEFMGGDASQAASNYFGKGVRDNNNGAYHPVDGGVQDGFHNYTSTWTKDQLTWWIDGKLVRTLNAKDAQGGQLFPQTPMKLSVGVWAGGDPRLPKGTNDWAGGVTDYAQGPFTMYVKSATVQDYSSGKEYTYGDKSGSWQSIKVVSGNSTAVENLNRTPDKSISEKWADLPSTTKIGIYSAAGGVVALLLVALIVYWIRQKRRGKREAEIAAKQQEVERLEMERFRKEGRDPDALAFDGQEVHSSKGDDMGGPGVTSTTYAVRPDYSRSNSLHSAHTGSEQHAAAWDPTSAAPMPVSPGMHSPMPLLHNDMNNSNPRIASPGPLHQGLTSPPPYNNNNNGYNMRSQSPSMPPSFPLPAAPSPRMASSPGPYQGQQFGGMDRMRSPGPMMQPPSRSGSRGGGYHQPQQQDYGQHQGYGGGGGAPYGGYR